MTDSLKICLIKGSIRDGRFNDVISNWVEKRLVAQGFEVTNVDPAAPNLLGVQTGDATAIANLHDLLTEKDGFVITTPEYNHAAPGPLKTLIDAAKVEWSARPVGLVSYGGISGGLRAAETLRLVFAELHAMTLRDTVSFAMPFTKFDETGEFREVAEKEAAETAMKAFGANLFWWAEALKRARLAKPYGAWMS